jgi:hypothetical protein
MRDFKHLDFDFTKAANGVLELKTLLATNKPLGERKHLLPFFRKRPHLCALIGQLNPDARQIDLIAYELSFFRDFSSDIALGDESQKAFTLIELEDASDKSVFVKGTKHHPDWSPRFEHGHSQIIDWLWRLADWRTTSDFDATFGKGAEAFVTLLIAGRDCHLDTSMRERLAWRRNNVVIHSKKILVYTYDGLLNALESRVGSIKNLQRVPKKAKAKP